MADALGLGLSGETRESSSLSSDTPVKCLFVLGSFMEENLQSQQGQEIIQN